METTGLKEEWVLSWVEDITMGIGSMLTNLPVGVIEDQHIDTTPERVAKAFEEYFAGCFEDPKAALGKAFKSSSDEMIYVNNIGFVSFCAHHLCPFMGRVHFAYIPKGRIVGLSKIPRLVEVFAKRPQLQEQLSDQLVGTFMDVLKPKGCGVVVEAYHTCMAIRGIKKEEAYTKTTALRGIFKTRSSVKSEFLDGVNHNRGGNLWP